MTEHIKSKVNVWVTLIGLILLLIGIYGSIRTVINFAFFKKYPTAGVISLTLMPMYGPREEDCVSMSYMPPFPPGDNSSMSAEDKKLMKEQSEQQKNSCLSSVKEAREQAKINDISTSLLALFLGAGVLALRKKLFSEPTAE